MSGDRNGTLFGDDVGRKRPREWQSSRANARSSDPGTSHAAAASIRERTVTRTKQAILRVLGTGPMTDEQIAEALEGTLQVSPSGLRTRRAELVDEGLVRDTGSKRRTRAGRRTIVWGLA